MHSMVRSSSTSKSPPTTPPPLLNDEQRRTQISDGHRLLRITREKRLALYSESEFLSRALYVDVDYFMHVFIPSLVRKISEDVTRRVNATNGRARKNAALYGVRKSGVPEHVAEALYDSEWFKPRAGHMPRPTLRDQITAIIQRNEPIELVFPIFSRKPFSPIKNRGLFPDLAEIVCLARCIAAAQTVNTLCPTGCFLTLLADGFKYSRACRTPGSVVSSYQAGLSYWLSALTDDNVVRLVNYEQWVEGHLRTDLLPARDISYEHYCGRLREIFSSMFDPDDLNTSISRIEQHDDIGKQLAYTFWSIVTSVHYHTLFGLTRKTSLLAPYLTTDIQRLYINFIGSLRNTLPQFTLATEYFPTIGHFSPTELRGLFAALRIEAWEAAIRYVSISLTDRDLNVLREIAPNAIKLTIHGKPAEINFRSAPHRSANMTAQHSTGGFTVSSGRAGITFRYRLEREAENETPVLLTAPRHSPSPHNPDEPLRLLHEAQQPIAYVNDRALAMEHLLHHALEAHN